MKKKCGFLAMALCAVMAVSLPACAPAKTGYTIGISQIVQHVALDAATQGFRDAVTAEFGDSVTFIEQNAQGDPATCAAIANSLVASKVDLILANATPALQAAAAATSEIPVLGTSITEYSVALDLKDFNGTVGGNVSGTSDLAPLDEQADMVHALFPDAANVGMIYCSAEANSLYQVETVRVALQAFGYAVTFFPFSDSNDLAAVATTAAAASDVIYIPTDNTVASNMGIIDNICRPAGVPIVAGEEGICAGGGAAALSIDYYDLGFATGKMAVKILKGESRVGEMPIEYAPNFTKKYNPEVCTELGIEIPADYTPLEP